VRPRNADGVQRLLQVLARHADIMAEAFAGPVVGGDRTRESALQDLMDVGALKPYDEGTFYLTGALYDYFSVSLASFHAFQTLTRIDGHLRQADKQWEELLLLKSSGSPRDVGRLEIALERTIIDTGDMVERNIQLLNSMVLGHYGNVDSFASKLRQNRFYAREVQSCLRELEKLEIFVDRLSDAARAAGQPRIRQLVRRRLGAQLFNWTSRLKDAQSVISRRLFEARLLETRLRQLARYGSWLSSNRSAHGWDIAELPANIDAALLRPEPIAVRPQPDIADPSPDNLGRLIELANRMKPATSTRRRLQDSGDALVLSDEMESIAQPLSAHQVALHRLLEHLSGGDQPVSLRGWKTQCAELSQVPDEHWLLYACAQLRAAHTSMRFVGGSCTEVLPVNETFHDVEVGPTAGANA
jgi:hypothetical protein